MLFRRGSTWWFAMNWQGQRIQQSTKSKNKTTARNVEAAFRKDCAEGRVGIVRKKRVLTFSEYALDFAEAIKTSVTKDTTRNYYTDSLKQLKKFAPLQKMPLNEITAETAGRYVAFRLASKRRHGTRPIKRRTADHEIAVLRRVLNCAEEAGVIEHSRLKKVKLAKPEQSTRVLTFAEERSYFDAAATHQPLFDICCLLLDSACRPDEAFRAEWQDVTLEPSENTPFGSIRNRFGKTKNAVRTLVLTPRTQAILQMRFEKQGRPVSGWVFPAKTKLGRVTSLASQHRAALKESGVAHFRIYALRHTALTRLVESGTSSLALKRIAGHSSVAVTDQFYIHTTESFTATAHANALAYNEAQRAKLRIEQEKEIQHGSIQ